MDRKYHKNLMFVHRILGTGITTGKQLYDLASRLFGSKFKGIHFRDRLPNLKHHGDFAIVNEPMNEHWISVFNYNGKLYEFDSFGRDMLGVPYHDFNVVGDAISEQRLDQADCGARVIAMMVTLFSQ